MSLNNKTKQPTEKHRRKERLLNEDETLLDYVTRLNGSDPPQCVTKDVDLSKCKENAEFLAEYIYKPFQIKQLVKNTIETHYGSCDICTQEKGKELLGM